MQSNIRGQERQEAPDFLIREGQSIRLIRHNPVQFSQPSAMPPPTPFFLLLAALTFQLPLLGQHPFIPDLPLPIYVTEPLFVWRLVVLESDKPLASHGGFALDTGFLGPVRPGKTLVNSGES